MPHDGSNPGRLSVTNGRGLDSLADFQTPILRCILCNKPYSFADITTFQFDYKSMVCGDCYDKMEAATESCFGKRYDSTVPSCKFFCPDRIMCERHADGRIRRLKDLTEEGRRAAVELLTRPKPVKRRAKHPFPQTSSLIRICWDLCVDGTTMHRLERECRRVAGDLDSILRKFRKQRTASFTWLFQESKEEVRIVWK